MGVARASVCGGVEHGGTLPYLDPAGRKMRMVAARFVSDLDGGMQIGRTYVCAKNDTV
jgi:hypothetical protein